MSWQSAIDSGIRGLVAASRGALEGQVAALQATNERAKHEAEIAWRNRSLDIEQQKVFLEDAFKHTELGEEGRQADQEDATKRFQIITTDDGQRYIVDSQGDTARAVAETGADATKYTADKGLEGTESTNKSRERSAQTAADATKYSADKQLEGTKDTNEARQAVADTQAAAAETTARYNYQATMEAVRGKGEQDRETLWEEYDIARQQRADRLARRAELGATGAVVPALQKEAREWALRVVKDVQASESYKYLESAQLQWEVIESGAEGFGGMSDLALVNAFQRMIDPGVSVREGDVALQLQTSSFLERLDLLAEKATSPTGEPVDVLTPSARAGLIGTAMSILNGQMDAFYLKRMTAANNMLQMESELADNGVTFEMLVPNIFQKVSLNPFELAGVAEEHWPANTAEDREKFDNDSLFGAAGSYRWRNNIDSLAAGAVREGWDAARIRLEMEGAWRARGERPNDEYIGLVLQRFAQLQAQQPETPNTQDAVPPPDEDDDEEQPNARPRQGGRSLRKEDDDEEE